MFRPHIPPPGLIPRLGSEAPRPSDQILKQVEIIWQDRLANSPGLFNGLIFSLDSIQGRVALGWSCPFKWYLAQLTNPELRGHLRVRSLAVSGLCLAKGHLVFGLRHPSLSLDGGLWELAPSGGISGQNPEPDGSFSFTRQFYTELREELGFAPKQQDRIEPFVIIEDTATNIWDMGLFLDLPVEPAELARLHRDKGCQEYSTLEFVPIDQLGSFLASRDGLVSGVSLSLLKARGFVPGD